jgi:hypothetical protein
MATAAEAASLVASMAAATAGGSPVVINGRELEALPDAANIRRARFLAQQKQQAERKRDGQPQRQKHQQQQQQQQQQAQRPVVGANRGAAWTGQLPASIAGPPRAPQAARGATTRPPRASSGQTGATSGRTAAAAKADDPRDALIAALARKVESLEERLARMDDGFEARLVRMDDLFEAKIGEMVQRVGRILQTECMDMMTKTIWPSEPVRRGDASPPASAASGAQAAPPAAAVAAPTGTGPPPAAVASPPVPAESWEEYAPPEVASATAAIGTKRARELSPGPDSSSTALVLCSDGLTAAPLLAVAGAPGVKRPARGTTPSSVAMDLDDHPTLALVPAASASTPMIGQGPAAGRAS